MLRSVLVVLFCCRAAVVRADDRCVGGWQTGDGYGDSSSYETYVGNYASREQCIDAVKSLNDGANAATYTIQAGSYSVGDCFAEYGQTSVTKRSAWENCLFADDQSAGSCYDYVTFTSTCNVMESTCTTQSGGGYWYAPGSIGWNGCCWCDDASCDHSLETGTDCSSKYSKTNYWEAGSGWCSSGLDDHVGDTTTASACWTMCEDRYGSDLVAIDWTPDGECYCQDDCQCMEDTDDSEIQLLTRGDVASLPNTCVSACPAEETAFVDCLSKQRSLDDDYFADDDDDDDDDDFSPNTCDDVQQWLSTGECDGPSVCRAEYNAWVECHYEDMAQSFLGFTCDLSCSAPTCLGRTACDWDGSPCAADEFCNFDGVLYGSCEKCSDEDHCDRGLPSEGEADCKACCSLGNEKSNRDNVMLLIIIIVCSVVGGCCLLAISTAIIYSFGGCPCFAKRKKKRMPARVAEPSSSAASAPVPLAVAEYVAAPPPMSPGTFAKTQEHIRRTAALMAEAPPSPGPPPLAPIKATETLPAEMP